MPWVRTYNNSNNCDLSSPAFSASQNVTCLPAADLIHTRAIESFLYDAFFRSICNDDDDGTLIMSG